MVQLFSYKTKLKYNIYHAYDIKVGGTFIIGKNNYFGTLSTTPFFQFEAYQKKSWISINIYTVFLLNCPF